jgi:hypothetical protein
LPQECRANRNEIARNPLAQERGADPIHHRGRNAGTAASEQENHALWGRLYLLKNKGKYAFLRTGMHMKNVLHRGGRDLQAASGEANFSA